MELRAGYKQTEVGVIPEEWDAESCSKLCVKIQDGTHFSPTIRGNDFLYLTSKNVRFGYLDVSTADRIDAAQHEAIYKRCDVKYGDLLLTKDGANTGNAALNTLTEQFSLLSSVALLRFDPKQHSAAYFLQQCLSVPGQQRMKDAMSGNAITRLTLEKIRKLRFPVAPLLEQRAIAEALSDVDELLGGLDRLIAKKRDLKQAAMQQLLTGQTRLPGFHGDWDWVMLQRIVDFANGKPHEGDVNESGEYLLITLDSIGSDGCLKADHKRVSCFDDSLKKNDIVTVLSTVVSNLDQGNILGLSDLVPEDKKYVLNQRMGRLRMKVNGSPRFVCLQMNRSREHFKQRGQGTSQKHIYRRDVDSLVIPFPSPNEQTAIAEVLTDMDAELAALEQRLAKTRALKQGMMQELLTGRIRLLKPEVVS